MQIVAGQAGLASFESTRPTDPVAGTARGGRAEQAVLDKNVRSAAELSKPSWTKMCAALICLLFSLAGGWVSRLALLGASFGKEYAQPENVFLVQLGQPTRGWDGQGRPR